MPGVRSAEVHLELHSVDPNAAHPRHNPRRPTRALESVVTGYVLAVSVALLAALPLGRVWAPLAAPRNLQIPLAALFALAWALNRGPVVDSAQIGVPRWVWWTLIAASLGAFVLSEVSQYRAFRLNGVDFSVFDLGLENTLRGRFMFTPVFDVDHFGIHPCYWLLPLVALHALVRTPYLLIAVNAAALVGAAFPLRRIGRRLTGSDALAALLAVGYLTCSFTGYLLNGGFRIESFYPLAGLWLVERVLAQDSLGSALALVGFLGIKEDAPFHAMGFAAGMALVVPSRRRQAALFCGVCLGVLALDLGVARPLALQGPEAQPAYLGFWSGYGTTLSGIAWGMLGSPITVARRVLFSGWPRLFGPALLLPLLDPWVVLALAPGVLMLGSASYIKMNGFESYYPAPLLPFALWGLAAAPRRLPGLIGTAGARMLAVAGLTLFPLVNFGYMHYWPPAQGLLQGEEDMRRRVAAISGRICAQTALFPHLPYGVDLAPLRDGGCVGPVVGTLVAPDADPYPLQPAALQAMVSDAQQRGAAEVWPGGYVLIHAQ